MTQERFTPSVRHWPAEAPPEDFAERAVSAMLASGASTRTNGVTPSKRTRRWGRLVLLAAFVSASAWGAYREVSQRMDAPSKALFESEVPRVAASSLEFSAPRSEGVAERAAATPRPDRPAPARVVSREQEPAPSAESVTPPKHVPAPRCQCAPGFVVCGCSE
jgi:hypothetical protein